jgi:hypothetical protein
MLLIQKCTRQHDLCPSDAFMIFFLIKITCWNVLYRRWFTVAYCSLKKYSL